MVVCKLHKIIRYCRRKRGTTMTTGEKLQNLRKENNYTQEELADILGVSRQSVSKWESDVAFPETDKLITLAKLYHCTVDYLLNSDNGNRETSIVVLGKNKGYNKKKLPFLITTLSVSLFTFIMFSIPWFEVHVQIYNPWYGTITELTGWTTFYQVIFSTQYRIGNVFALLSFLVAIAIPIITTIYLCVDKKVLGTLIKILNCVLLGLLFIVMMFTLNNGWGWSVWSLFEFVSLTILIVLQFALKPFRKIE